VYRSLLAGVLGLTLVATMAALLTARQPAGDGPSPAIDTEPVRTSAPAPVAAAPAPVPPEAEALQPVAFTLVTTWTGGADGPRTVKQHVTRARDRVHLVLDEGRREWHFERNPVYPERVSGALVDHAAREILAHSESDLRSRLGIRGWADVLMIRFDRRSLAELRDTGERQAVEGVAAAHYVAPDSGRIGIADLWWSQEWLLPLSVTTRESKTVIATARVLRLSSTVDPVLLIDPAQRYPAYRVVDLSDAGESH
jgi:hypothetical protein